MDGGRRRLATGVVALLVAAALVGPVVASGLVLADGDADRGHGNECDGTDADNPGDGVGVDANGVDNREAGGADGRERARVHPPCDGHGTGEETTGESSVATPTATATSTSTETPTATPTARPSGGSTQGAGGGSSTSSSTATPVPTTSAPADERTTQQPDGRSSTPTDTPTRSTPRSTEPPSVPPGAAPGSEQPGLGGEAPPLPMVEDVPGLSAPADVEHTTGDVAVYSIASAGIVGLATGLGWLFVRP